MKAVVFWDATPCSLVDVTDDSEKRATSIFRVEVSFTLKRKASRFSEKWLSIF
jgi:hypothetical protein